MSITKLGNEKDGLRGKKSSNFIKKISDKIFSFLSGSRYYDDETGVDTRTQTERNLEKTGEMYYLEKERNKEETEKYKKDGKFIGDGEHLGKLVN
ncbi:MAG: hypothetical protein M0P94_02690 [Candidatus Absconditabacterales bacterium]|nr:hypothetical protein [Candidatus Absconditabacterales bacterium]